MTQKGSANMENLFEPKQVFTNIPELLNYLPTTLELTLISFLISLAVGLLLGVIKMKKIPVLTQLANLFISIIRGTPVLVQLYVTYFGIPMFLKYINYLYGTSYNVNSVPGIVYAFVALGLNSAAYMAETIRSAFESVESGQIEAATSLGMTYGQTLRRIILPEALTVALPNLGNSFISLMKGTSLAFTCGVVEMTAEGKIIGGRSFRYFEVYLSLALIYWVLTVAVEQILKLVEKKTRIPEEAPEMAAGDSREAEAAV